MHDIWTLIIQLILTGVAFVLFSLAYKHIEKAPITEPWMKWGLLTIPVVILIAVVAAVWGLHLPA